MKRSRELGLAGSEGMVRFLQPLPSLWSQRRTPGSGSWGSFCAWRRVRPGMGTDLDMGMVLLVFFVGSYRSFCAWRRVRPDETSVQPTLPSIAAEGGLVG